MSDSTTHLDAISVSQSSKEVTANALFDAMSQNALFGRRASTTSVLTWGYYGGKYRKADGTILSVANGTIALTDSATNYILETDGVVSKVTAAPDGWPGPLLDDASPASETGATALYAVVCSGGAVTSYTDYRTLAKGATGAAGATGATGAAGQGVPAGGTTGQQLKKSSGTDYDTEWYSEPFDVHAFYPGEPTDAAIILRVPVARAVAFPANFSGSYAKASAASTGTVAVDVKKNGSSIGTITFTTSATGTFASSGGSAQSLAAGDVIELVAPATADATLADIGIVLAGTR